MLSRFTRNRDSIHIGDGDQARFTGLVLEARELLKQELGAANAFGHQLEMTRLEGTRNYLGSQSYHSVEQAEGILRSAAKTMERRTDAASSLLPTAALYVDGQRLAELRSISSAAWDLRRLIRMCEELNASFAGANFHATAMLVRAITDHVPPVFGASSFPAYASSIASRSTKGTMERLAKSLRDIADGALHIQMRAQETLPTSTQVDFRQELDVLLGEVVRLLSSRASG